MGIAGQGLDRFRVGEKLHQERQASYTGNRHIIWWPQMLADSTPEFGRIPFPLACTLIAPIHIIFDQNKDGSWKITRELCNDFYGDKSEKCKNCGIPQYVRGEYIGDSRPKDFMLLPFYNMGRQDQITEVETKNKQGQIEVKQYPVEPMTIVEVPNGHDNWLTLRTAETQGWLNSELWQFLRAPSPKVNPRSGKNDIIFTTPRNMPSSMQQQYARWDIYPELAESLKELECLNPDGTIDLEKFYPILLAPYRPNWEKLQVKNPPIRKRHNETDGTQVNDDKQPQQYAPPQAQASVASFGPPGQPQGFAPQQPQFAPQQMPQQPPQQYAPVQGQQLVRGEEVLQAPQQPAASKPKSTRKTVNKNQAQQAPAPQAVQQQIPMQQAPQYAPAPQQLAPQQPVYQQPQQPAYQQPVQQQVYQQPPVQQQFAPPEQQLPPIPPQIQQAAAPMQAASMEPQYSPAPQQPVYQQPVYEQPPQQYAPPVQQAPQYAPAPQQLAPQQPVYQQPPVKQAPQPAPPPPQYAPPQPQAPAPVQGGVPGVDMNAITNLLAGLEATLPLQQAPVPAGQR